MTITAKSISLPKKSNIQSTNKKNIDSVVVYKCFIYQKNLVIATLKAMVLIRSVTSSALAVARDTLLCAIVCKVILLRTLVFTLLASLVRTALLTYLHSNQHSC